MNKAKKHKQPDIFISYPDKNRDLIENFREHLSRHGVEAWVYSQDKTLGEKAWIEIANKIRRCKAIIFAASKHSVAATGQHREIKLALRRLQQMKGHPPLMAAVLDDVAYKDLPKPLGLINSFNLAASNVATSAYDVARRFFPRKFPKKGKWRAPRAGQWLEVSALDPRIEAYFQLGDQVYFRQVDPLGLFEVYAPRIKDLFWILPQNVKAVPPRDDEWRITDEQVPYAYRITTMYEMLRDGFHKLRSKGMEI